MQLDTCQCRIAGCQDARCMLCVVCCAAACDSRQQLRRTRIGPTEQLQMAVSRAVCQCLSAASRPSDRSLMLGSCCRAIEHIHRV